MRWCLVVLVAACGDDKAPPPPVPVAPEPAPRGTVAYDDKDEPAPVTPLDAAAPDAPPEPPARKPPAKVDMKTELRAIKSALAKISAKRDAAAKRAIACELAGEIEQHAFNAQSLPDPEGLDADKRYAYRNEVMNLHVIGEDMIGHCKDNEPDGIDLDLEQMPHSFARLVQLVPKAQRP